MTRHRLSLVAVAAYLLLLATVPSGLFRSFELGDEETWLRLVGVLLVAASVALGATVARASVLLVPTAAAACFALVAVSQGDFFAVYLVMLVLPVLLAATAIGWALGRVRRLALPVAAVGFAVAFAPVAIAAVSMIERAGAPVLSPAEQARLPARWGLVELCGGAERRNDVRRRLRRQAAQLVQDVRVRPNHLVDVTNFSDEREPEQGRISVRDRAEEELEGLSQDSDCVPGIQRDLRCALGVP